MYWRSICASIRKSGGIKESDNFSDFFHYFSFSHKLIKHFMKIVGNSLVIMHPNIHSASLRSSIHSLRIRMTSYPCNKYEQITPSYRLSVKYIYIYISEI